MRNNIKDNYEYPFTGIVTIGYRSKTTNNFTPIIHKKNLILYGAADVMAKLVSGDSNYAISHMYYNYTNTNSTPAIPAINREDGLQYFTTLAGTNDWLRIPILTSAKIDKYNEFTSPAPNNVYAGNMATFVATSASHPSQTGERNLSSPNDNYFASSGVNGPSKITGVALAVSPDPYNKYKDIVFSRLALSSPITIQANSYVDCFWSIAFK